MQNRKKASSFSLSPQKAHLLRNESRSGRPPFWAASSPDQRHNARNNGRPGPGSHHPRLASRHDRHHRGFPYRPVPACASGNSFNSRSRRPRQNEIKPRQINGKRPRGGKASLLHLMRFPPDRNPEPQLHPLRKRTPYCPPARPTAIPAQERHWRTAFPEPG